MGVGHAGLFSRVVRDRITGKVRRKQRSDVSEGTCSVYIKTRMFQVERTGSIMAQW